MEGALFWPCEREHSGLLCCFQVKYQKIPRITPLSCLEYTSTGRPDALSRLARAAREKLIGSNEGETNPQHIAPFAEAAGFVERPSPALIETLVELLLHADQEVRIQAALALGRLQQPLPDRAWQHLFAMRRDRSICSTSRSHPHAA